MISEYLWVSKMTLDIDLLESDRRQNDHDIPYHVAADLAAISYEGIRFKSLEAARNIALLRMRAMLADSDPNMAGLTEAIRLASHAAVAEQISPVEYWLTMSPCLYAPKNVLPESHPGYMDLSRFLEDYRARIHIRTVLL